jgi:hypothetical protein
VQLHSRLGLNWRSINAPNQLTRLLAGYRYTDGKLCQARQDGGDVCCTAG